jgi:hypothetical protein
MHELEISSVEKQSIIAVDDSGAQYRLDVDDASLARLKRAASATDAKVSPREIQTLLRSGLAPAEVGAMTGATAEQIDRYAGPVVAEREYVINSSMSLPAFAHIDTSEDTTSFSDLVTDRLDAVDARDREWTAWKDDSARWILKLTFVVSGADRDARWVFDGKRHTVTPHNDEAKRLSAPGSFDTGGLIPALRAVPAKSSAADLAAESTIPEVSSAEGSTPLLIEANEAVVTPISANALIELDETPASNTTEDLLEALRKRRHSSEKTPAWLREDVASRTAPVEEIFQDSLDIPLDNLDTPDDSLPLTPAPLTNTGGHKRSRPTLPSWDEIVSETKSDDDLI